MNKTKKLDEAKYFRLKMEERKFNKTDFINYLSAFLTSSRTIFQYALEEFKVSETDIGKRWYDKKISESKIFKFFRNKRDLNIHERPIQANATLTVKTKSIIRFLSNSRKKKQKEETNEDIIYFFDDWDGNENILVLCDNYINEIESFINEGVKLNHITG